MQIFDIVYDLVQPCRYGKSIAAWIRPVKRVKDHGLLHRIFKISLHHGQFIEIG